MRDEVAEGTGAGDGDGSTAIPVRQRRLSSRSITVFYRLILPAFVGIGGFAFQIPGIAQALAAGHVHWMIFATGVFWLALVTWCVYRGRRFKDVWLVGDELEVRTRRSTRRIPLSGISHVELTHPYDRPRFTRVRFDVAPQSADVLLFIPLDANFTGGGTGATEELRDLVRRAQGRHL